MIRGIWGSVENIQCVSRILWIDDLEIYVPPKTMKPRLLAGFDLADAPMNIHVKTLYGYVTPTPTYNIP